MRGESEAAVLYYQEGQTESISTRYKVALSSYLVNRYAQLKEDIKKV